MPERREEVSGPALDQMRIWWLVLGLTISSVVTMLLAPPMSGHGSWCDHAAGLIVITPGYTDGEMAGSDPDADRRTCAGAAWRQTGLAGGVAVVGVSATWGTRRIGIRRRGSVATG